MLYQLLKYLGIILIILTTSQCLSKCKQKPPYDTVNLDLKWEDEPKQINLSGLDLENAKGLICYLPSRKATYFLNAADGNCWEFTKDGDGLACNSITNLAPFDLGSSFVFVAGSTEQESLFFGTISISGDKINVYQLESGSWNKIVDAEDLTLFFPGTTIDTSKFVASCTMEQKGEKKGCLVFKLYPANSAQAQLGCLLFSTEAPHFNALKIDPTHNPSFEKKHLTGMVTVRNNKIILGMHTPMRSDTYALISLKDDQIIPLIPDMPSGFPSTGIRPTWEIFPLFLEGEYPIAEPIFSTYHQNKRSIYRMDMSAEGEGVLQKMTLLSDLGNKILNQKSFIIPLYNELYWITTLTKEDGNQETVSYKGTLVTIAKEAERKP